jgi:hypothetical protein
METFIVFLTLKQPGISGSFRTVRYIDSQWASEDHAIVRKTELCDSMRMFDVPDWSIDIRTGTVPDVAITGGGGRHERRPDHRQRRQALAAGAQRLFALRGAADTERPGQFAHPLERDELSLLPPVCGRNPESEGGMIIRETLEIEIREFEDFYYRGEAEEYRMNRLRQALGEFVRRFAATYTGSEAECDVLTLGIARDIFESVNNRAVAEWLKERLTRSKES